MSSLRHLHLNCIKTNPQVVKLLPQDVARRYHALPVATDGNRITIAMASPKDTIAANAVSSAIGTPVYLVQADPKEIDQRLAEIWRQNPTPRLCLLVWSTIAENNLTLLHYAQAIADCVQANLNQLNLTSSDVKSFATFFNTVEQLKPDLIIFTIPTPPLTKWLRPDFVVNKLLDQLSTSILVVKNPQWPIQRILLAIRDGNEPSKAAVDWIIRLAHNNHAIVSVLPLLPPVPQMYGSFIGYNLPSLLSSNDPLGEKMRRIAQRLTTEKIEGVFKIRDGSPLEQLRDEMSDGNFDLVIIEDEPQNHLWRWLFGDVANNLFTSLDRPVLVTKSITP